MDDIWSFALILQFFRGAKYHNGIVNELDTNFSHFQQFARNISDY